MPIDVKNLTFSYDHKIEGNETTILHELTCSFLDGKVSVLLGRSACGKTTFLKLLAGLLPPKPDESAILIDGATPRVAASKRILAFLPQDFQPAPWQTASENVEFVIKLAHPKQAIPRETADALLRNLGLSQFAQSYPKDMSGGQVRRLALAMSLAIRPRYLLLDEPFTALDIHTKYELYTFIRTIWQTNTPAAGSTSSAAVPHLSMIVLVSHDVDDALFLADSVYVMSGEKPTGALIHLTGPNWDRLLQVRANTSIQNIPILSEFGPARKELQEEYSRALFGQP